MSWLTDLWNKVTNNNVSSSSKGGVVGSLTPTSPTYVSTLTPSSPNVVATLTPNKTNVVANLGNVKTGQGSSPNVQGTNNTVQNSSYIPTTMATPTTSSTSSTSSGSSSGSATDLVAQYTAAVKAQEDQTKAWLTNYLDSLKVPDYTAATFDEAAAKEQAANQVNPEYLRQTNESNNLYNLNQNKIRNNLSWDGGSGQSGAIEQQLGYYAPTQYSDIGNIEANRKTALQNWIDSQRSIFDTNETKRYND